MSESQSAIMASHLFDGRVASITCASRGIGRAIAQGPCEGGCERCTFQQADLLEATQEMRAV